MQFPAVATKKVQALKGKLESKLPEKQVCETECTCHNCPNQWLSQPKENFVNLTGEHYICNILVTINHVLVLFFFFNKSSIQII